MRHLLIASTFLFALTVGCADTSEDASSSQDNLTADEVARAQNWTSPVGSFAAGADGKAIGLARWTAYVVKRGDADAVAVVAEGEDGQARYGFVIDAKTKQVSSMIFDEAGLVREADGRTARLDPRVQASLAKELENIRSLAGATSEPAGLRTQTAGHAAACTLGALGSVLGILAIGGVPIVAGVMVYSAGNGILASLATFFGVGIFWAGVTDSAANTRGMIDDVAHGVRATVDFCFKGTAPDN